MANTNPEELEAVFTDVRKAYRLLYHYQRRVMDTVRYISNLLSINLQSGHPIFSDLTPGENKRPDLDRWAWDWLNMYFYEFYCTAKKIDTDTYQFAIQIQSDTGCYDTGANELDIENYSPAELAATRLIFIYSKNRWKGEQQEDHKRFTGFHSIPALSANQPSTFKEEHDNGDKFFVMMTMPLENLVDESSIKSEIDRFLQFLKQNNLTWAYEGQRI
jgi:hypothetical protein